MFSSFTIFVFVLIHQPNKGDWFISDYIDKNIKILKKYYISCITGCSWWTWSKGWTGRSYLNDSINVGLNVHDYALPAGGSSWFVGVIKMLKASGFSQCVSPWVNLEFGLDWSLIHCFNKLKLMMALLPELHIFLPLKKWPCLSPSPNWFILMKPSIARQ